MGEIKQGIIVGLKAKQLPGFPRFDTNNVVLINEDGSPLGTKIHVPIPMQLKDILKGMTHHKKADFTKVLKIASTFV
jgi:large subunit ribosomal protein L14